MSVKIFTEGGKRIGLGHVSRCSAIVEELAARGIICECIVFGDSTVIEFFRSGSIILKNWLDDDYLRTHISGDDYIIVDSYLAECRHYELIKEKAKRAIIFDDIGRLIYPEGVIVNPALDSSSVDYSGNKGHIILTGPKYVILRHPFLGKKRKTLNVRIENVLITLGSTGSDGLSEKIQKIVCAEFGNATINVVDCCELQRLEFCENCGGNINQYSHVNASQMCELMMNADLAISSAGQTVNELIFTQTPFIAVQVAENQSNNYSAIKRLISSEIAVQSNKQNFVETITNLCKQMCSPEFRRSIFKNADGLVDGYGSRRIVDALLDDYIDPQFLRVRNMSHADIQEVFYLSNQDYVRRHSIQKNKIDWNDHARWFDNALSNDRCLFLALTDGTNKFLGQIRFDIEGHVATVSISLSKEVKGKGFSVRVLEMGVARLFKEKNEVDTVIAFISSTNAPSIKLFEGAHFHQCGKQGTLLRYELKRGNKHEDWSS